jgi:hypothetical protein
MDDHSAQSRTDQEFIIRHLRTAGIPVLIPTFPRGSDGGLDVREFMVSKIDRHPNRHYNVVLSTQVLDFLEGAGIVGTEQARNRLRASR